MKKFGIAGLIVGLMILSISTGVWAVSVSKNAYPKLNCPMYMTLHSNFSQQYTVNLTDYARGWKRHDGVGKIEVGGPDDLKIEVRLNSVPGAGNSSKAAQAFQIRERGQSWADFTSVPQTLQLNYLVGPIYYMTNWIDYYWNLKELGSANAGCNLQYNLTFIVTSI